MASSAGNDGRRDPPCASSGLADECPHWCEYADPPPLAGEVGPAPEVGTTLSGGYLLREVIGRGGMGRVFSASDAVGKPVAVKVIRDDAVAERLPRGRFVTEARAMALIDHPNVLRLLDNHEDAPWPFFVTELVRGGDLRGRVVDAGPYGLGLPRVLEVLDALSAGVAAIHAAGVVHMDLKPSNVLIEDGRRVVICDFGLARPSARPCRFPRGELAGTPGFIAPEVVEGRQPAPRPSADVYALGVIAYELLTGAPVFEGPSTSSRMQRACIEDPPPPAEINPDVSKALDDAVMRALDRTPGTRPTAHEFRDAVRG